MAKIKRAKRQTMVTTTLHRKLKIGLHEFNKNKQEVNSNSAIFQLYHGQNISSLKQQSVDRHVPSL